jgi:hypothetical protein
MLRERSEAVKVSILEVVGHQFDKSEVGSVKSRHLSQVQTDDPPPLLRHRCKFDILSAPDFGCVEERRKFCSLGVSQL